MNLIASSSFMDDGAEALGNSHRKTPRQRKGKGRDADELTALPML